VNKRADFKTNYQSTNYIFNIYLGTINKGSPQGNIYHATEKGK